MPTIATVQIPHPATKVPLPISLTNSIFHPGAYFINSTTLTTTDDCDKIQTLLNKARQLLTPDADTIITTFLNNNKGLYTFASHQPDLISALKCGVGAWYISEQGLCLFCIYRNGTMKTEPSIVSIPTLMTRTNHTITRIK